MHWRVVLLDEMGVVGEDVAYTPEDAKHLAKLARKEGYTVRIEKHN